MMISRRTARLSPYKDWCKAMAGYVGMAIAYYSSAAQWLPKGQPRRGSEHENGAAMGIQTSKIVRVLKRLKAAVGYHELGMTQHALRCLDSLVSLGGKLDLLAWSSRSCGASSSSTPSVMSPQPRPWRRSPACCRRLAAAMEMTFAACYGQVERHSPGSQQQGAPAVAVRCPKPNRSLPARHSRLSRSIVFIR